MFQGIIVRDEIQIFDIISTFLRSNQILGTNMYLYPIKERNNINDSAADLDWPFPDKYSLKIGVSLKGFTFNITPKVNNELRNF